MKAHGMFTEQLIILAFVMKKIAIAITCALLTSHIKKEILRFFISLSFKTHREIFHSRLARYLDANKRNLNEIKCRIRKSIKMKGLASA